MVVTPELYAAVEATHTYAQAVACKVNFNLGHEPDRYLLSYFATTIELTGGCLALVREQQFISIPILTRSVLEAWVDFVCLTADASYSKFIDAAHDSGVARMIDQAVLAGNQYLQQLGKEPSVLADREEIRKRDLENKKLGVKMLLAKERFERAGLTDMYYSVYSHLSAECHNDMRVLIQRHLTYNEAEGVRLTLYRADPPFVATSLFQILDLLTGMSMKVCERFGLDPPDRSRMDKTHLAATKLIEKPK